MKWTKAETIIGWSILILILSLAIFMTVCTSIDLLKSNPEKEVIQDLFKAINNKNAREVSGLMDFGWTEANKIFGEELTRGFVYSKYSNYKIINIKELNRSKNIAEFEVEFSYLDSTKSKKNSVVYLSIRPFMVKNKVEYKIINIGLQPMEETK